MDWTGADPNENRTVEIAVVKLEATVPVTDQKYGGAVVLNPGGPGGSGVRQGLTIGHAVRTMLSAGPDSADSESAKYYDVIGFDPRGVNNTTPTFACFPNYIESMLWEMQTSAFGVFGSSDTAFDVNWERIRALADSCSKRAMEDGIGMHMSTANVARDIVEIFERHGEWREKEAKRVLASPRLVANQAVLSKGDSYETALSRVKYEPGEEMVQYWGFSYGTILGATLSAMFPDKIKRAILDGVADSFDYMQGGWTTNLQDTDLNMARFGEYCYNGGPENCAMYHEDGPAVILENFGKIIGDLRDTPVGVPATDKRGAQIATYSDVKRLLWNKMYNPLREFETIAKAIKELSEGNATTLIEWKTKGKDFSEGLSKECKENSYSSACFPHGPSMWDATAGILCGDAEPQTNMTKEDYWGYASSLMATSRLIGDTWATIRMPCTAWNVRPLWRYEGNFTATTAHPIMFIGNTVDPVTPLRNAFRMAKGFEGAVVLHQDSEGHCTSASPSFCSGRAIRKYFQTGELPKKGTICQPARLPFDGYNNEEKPELPEGETDQELWDAMVHINRISGI